MSISDKILLRKRALIETVNDELKNIAQIEHSRHRSFNNFITNSLSAIAAYCFFEKKPAIDVNFINDGQLSIFWFYVELTLKYNYFHKEQKRSFRNNPFLSANFYYNEETEGMYCPMGQRMERLSDTSRVTDNDFVQTISRYRARNCKGCSLRCRWERIVQVNHRLRKIKEKEREKLLSDEGLRYRSQRPQDMEAVFGNLKNNKHFKRFHLRGQKKVEFEFGLLAIAHNLAKVTS